MHAHQSALEPYIQIQTQADQLNEEPSPAAAVSDMLKQALAGKSFQSLADAQAFIDHKMQQLNSAPQTELGGLSTAELHTLLYGPMEQQTLIRWQDPIKLEGTATPPILAIFNAIKHYLDNHSAKATAKGNFPTALVQYVLDAYQPFIESDIQAFRFSHVKKEDDFQELHTAKIVFKQAGLLRIHKKHFVLTAKAHRLCPAEILKLLLTTHMEKYNWAYGDGYPDAPLIQTAARYSLMMLGNLEQKTQTTADFAESFLDTFPMLPTEFEDHPYSSNIDQATNAYLLRTIERFWQFFGLIEPINHNPKDKGSQPLRTTPLLNALFDFNQCPHPGIPLS
jgi:hypothetical protein